MELYLRSRRYSNIGLVLYGTFLFAVYMEVMINTGRINLGLGGIITCGILGIISLIGGVYYRIKGKKYFNKHKIFERWEEKYFHKDRNWKEIEEIYLTINREEKGINSQTINDLKIKEIFKKIDICFSSIGEFALLKILRNPLMNKEEIYDRDKKVQWINRNGDKREALMGQFFKLGKDYKNGFTEMIYNENFKKFSKSERGFIFVLSKLWVISVVLVFLGEPMYGFLFLFATAIVNRLFQRAKKFNSDIDALCMAMAGRVIVTGENIGKILSGNEEYKEVSEELLKLTKECSGIKKNSSITSKSEIPADPQMEIFKGYIESIFLYSLRKYTKVSKYLEEKRSEIERLAEILGELEGLVAIAHFREKNDYCIPEIHGENTISGKGMKNPLVENCVENSLDISRGIIITGCNMSGKSTFLRTLGMCQLMAQSIVTVPAESYKTSLFKIITSIDIHDDIENKKSYYFVEIENIKRILDENSLEIPVLAIIDEILNGTNPTDRIAASTSILEFMSKKNYRPIVATHDMELRDNMDHKYDSYYFTEDVEKEEMVFDYKIRAGRSINRNAIKLLKIMDYPEEILKSI